MPILPAFLLMAQTAQGAPVSVTLHYRRPSTVVAQAVDLGATFVADDARSEIRIGGTPEQVRDAREFLRLFDVPRRAFLVRIAVSSPVDHLDWTVNARLTTGQRWKTADEETGAEIALEPTLGGDGVLQVSILARCGHSELNTRLRLAKGRAQSLDLGKRIEQRVDASPLTGEAKVTAEAGVSLPKVTLEYVGP